MVQLRLLGPVELVVRGNLVELGPPQRRTVLAALAVDAGRPVQVDVLAERVWGADRPDGARRALYAHVARIRRTCEATGDGAGEALRIVRRSGGYQLEAGPDQVDLHRFRRLTELARQRGQDLGVRASLLTDALALWRGEPLAGLEGQWIARVRETWRRERVDAAVRWAQGELRGGDPDAVVAPLTSLLEEHPLAEPLAEALMRALHATGDSAGALKCFAAIGERLAEELGTDPGQRLREAHQAVLRGLPADAAAVTNLDVGPVRIRSAVGVIPAQLPMGVGGFTGRGEELARLRDILAVAGRQPTAVVISAVSGTAGVGKTALAVHWARQMSDVFPDGQLYVNLRGFDDGGAVTPAQALRGFLDALGVSPQNIPRGVDAQAALYRSLLAGRRVLILLDNARDAGQVRPLLPGAPGCLALVTSRNRLTGLAVAEGASLLPLDLLDPAEARELLAVRLGSVRVAAEPAAVDEIVVQCAGLPLALAVVAARAATEPRRPLAELAEELRTADRRLDPLDGDDPSGGVRAVFSWSYRMLSPNAARLFRMLSLHPGPDAAPPAVAALAGVTEERARALLAELTDAHLLTEHRPGRHTFHDLLRAYAAECTAAEDDDAARHTATLRMLDHYLHTAWAADALLTRRRDPLTLAPPLPGAQPGRPADHRAALAWFTAEQLVLLSAVERTPAGFDAHTWQLAATLTTFLERRGDWQELASAHTTALRAARLADDTAGRANAHRGLGLAWARLERTDRAEHHYLLALGLFAELGNEAGQARMHQNLAAVASADGRYPEALDHAHHTLEHYRCAHDRGGQAIALNHIGWYHTKLGDHRRALAYCEQALGLVQEIGDLSGQAHTLDSLGYIHRHLGRHARSVACYGQALELFRKTEDRRSEAIGHAYLGDTHEDAGDLAAARQAWARAVEIFDDLGLPDAEPLRARLARGQDGAKPGPS
ncbi:BTAD domain-containing putative transcriptional regulator [Streptomyces sp. NPDC001027]|uniref:AfsR/SARP family transcriptional regulator n=1 Tax=Streptomyces sp. NPDC001027 TaxID=3154771 RepID=UPI00331D59F2